MIEVDHGAQRLNILAGWGITPGLYYQYTERSRTLKSLAIYATEAVTLTGDGEPERIRVTRATPSLASVTGVAPAVGRWFTDAEGIPGAPAVGVLANGFWARRYGASPDVIGRLVMLDGIPTKIIGVMPRSFAFPSSQVEMWTPVPIDSSRQRHDDQRQSRSGSQGSADSGFVRSSRTVH